MCGLTCVSVHVCVPPPVCPQSASDLVLRAATPFNYCVIDEVDSILIDEARTPLIISGPSDKPSDKYYKVCERSGLGSREAVWQGRDTPTVLAQQALQTEKQSVRADKSEYAGYLRM